MTDLDKLIADHWIYTERTLNAHNVPEHEVLIARHYYHEVWRHAVKHERERVESERRELRDAMDEHPEVS